VLAGIGVVIGVIAGAAFVILIGVAIGALSVLFTAIWMLRRQISARLRSR